MMPVPVLLPAILASILCFLGLPAGKLLANLAKEEIPTGKQYLTILRTALAALTLWFGTEQLLTTQLGLFGIVVGVTLILSRRNLFSLAYPLWGLLLGLNIGHDIPLLAGSIFLFGLVEAALRIDSKHLLNLKPLDLAFFVSLAAGLLI